MDDYIKNKNADHMGYREMLRSSYRKFEEDRKRKKEAERRDYPDLETDMELQRIFTELFGDDND